MKKIIWISVIFLLFVASTLHAQHVVVKNNLLYDATTTPNLSVEFATGRKHTFDFLVGFNPFTFEDNKKLTHLLVQPEWRYWTCERFNGLFWGVHAQGGLFNVGGVKMPFGFFKSLQKFRYEGWFAGGGFSVGYQWVLSRRFSLETEIGAGYTYLDYEKFCCKRCGSKFTNGHKHYFGITRAAISLVYVLK